MKLILLLLVVLATGEVGRIIYRPQETEGADSATDSGSQTPRIPVLRDYVKDWKDSKNRLPCARPPQAPKGEIAKPYYHSNTSPRLGDSNAEEMEIVGYDIAHQREIPAFRIPRAKHQTGAESGCTVQEGRTPSKPDRVHHSDHLESVIPSVAEHLQVHNSPPSPVEVPEFPFNAVYLMTVQFGNDMYRCTGWPIGDFHIATAGHCVYDFEQGWAKKITVYPSVGGQAAWGVAEVTQLYVESGYSKAPSWAEANHWDIAWAKLSWKIGSRTGWMARSSTLNSSSDLNYLGYPYDGPYNGNVDLIYSTAHVLQNDDPFQFYTTGESFGGNSGGPIYSHNDNRTIVGLLSGGTSGQETDRPFSFWTRLTSDRLQAFDSQMKNDSAKPPPDQPELIEAVGALFGEEPFTKLTPRVLSPGDSGTFDLAISNTGFKASNPIRIVVVMNADPLGNGTSVQIGEHDDKELQPNTFNSYSVPIRIPADTQPGTYYVLAVFAQDGVEYTPSDSFAYRQINVTATSDSCPEHRCSNNHCLSNIFVCDGNNDCSDGGDEQNCACQTSQFSCMNKKCVPQASRCDGKNDCGDFSDELNCTCIFDEWQCGSTTQCIPKTLVCNGNNDCPNGEDEDPSHCSCPSGFTPCRSPVSQCVSNDHLCDFYFDCADHSDETNCNCDGGFGCANGGCIPNSWKCDNYNDCGDWSDEVGCKCPSNSSRCTDPPMCVSRTYFCDGVHDCGAGEDEANCTCDVCGNKQCIPQHFICDGVEDCKNGKDEDNCGGNSNNNSGATHITSTTISLLGAILLMVTLLSS